VLFAVIAGFSLGIMSGRARPHTGEALIRTRLRILVRSALLLAMGTGLALLGPPVGVILGYYAAWFALALPVLSWRPRNLFILAAVIAVVGPVIKLGAPVALSHLGMTAYPTSGDGNAAVVSFLITGFYPGALWMAYIFLGLGLFIISLAPAGISIQTIALGNVLAITPGDLAQLVAISLLTFLALLLKWRDWLAVFFDESHARSVGLHVTALKAGFFAMLAACTIAAMQAVGAFLVIALIITPGATAWLLSDRFGRVAAIATAIGVASGLIGAWASYFLDGATGAVIVLLQTALFALAFVFAPRHGLLAARRRARASASKADAPAAARSCS